MADLKKSLQTRVTNETSLISFFKVEHLDKVYLSTKQHKQLKFYFLLSDDIGEAEAPVFGLFLQVDYLSSRE